jgi:hypothetical protein
MHIYYTYIPLSVQQEQNAKLMKITFKSIVLHHVFDIKGDHNF